MDLDSIQPRHFPAHRGGNETLHDRDDLLMCQGAWQISAGKCARHRGGGHRLKSADDHICLTTAVGQLQGDPAAGGVHRIGHALQPGDDMVGVRAALKWSTFADGIDVRRLHPQQTNPATGSRDEIVDIALSHHAVGCAQVLFHRCHQHTVGQW